MMVNNGYHLVMTNIAMENPQYSHGGLVRWENHLFLWAIYTMAMLNTVTRGYFFWVGGGGCILEG